MPQKFVTLDASVLISPARCIIIFRKLFLVEVLPRALPLEYCTTLFLAADQPMHEMPLNARLYHYLTRHMFVARRRDTASSVAEILFRGGFVASSANSSKCRPMRAARLRWRHAIRCPRSPPIFSAEHRQPAFTRSERCRRGALPLIFIFSSS